MKVYSVQAVHVYADHDIPDIVSIHKTKLGAQLKADELNKLYQEAKENDWYKDVSDPDSGMPIKVLISEYQTEAKVIALDVIDD